MTARTATTVSSPPSRVSRIWNPAAPENSDNAADQDEPGLDVPEHGGRNGAAGLRWPRRDTSGQI